jgi:hypothetical protein
LKKKLIPKRPEAIISTIVRSGQVLAGTPRVRRALKHEGENGEAGHVFIPNTARATSTQYYNRRENRKKPSPVQVFDPSDCLIRRMAGGSLMRKGRPPVAPGRSLTIGTPERSQSDHCGIAQDKSSGSERRRRRTRRSCDLKGPLQGREVLKQGLYEAAALHGVAANRSCFHSMFLRQLQRVSVVHTGL